MKAALLELLAGEPHGVQARNTAREYLRRLEGARVNHGPCRGQPATLPV